ncbi:MAG: hypothetical protein ACOCWB_06050, partial [Bacteroidota bacterium]
REGSFSYISDGQKIYVERTLRRQIETMDKGQMKVILKVNWKSETEYDLIVRKTKGFPGIYKGDVVSVSVNACDENTYEIEAVSGDVKRRTRFVKE